MIERLSRWISRAIDILFVDNPNGTSMGVLGGVLAYALVHVFRPLLLQQDIVDLLSIHPAFFICGGVFIANFRRLRRGTALPAAFEARLHLLRDEIRVKRLPRREAQRLYRELLEEAVAEVVKHRTPKGPTAA